MEKKIDQFFEKSLRWTLNGWSAHEIAGFALCVALCSPLVVSGLLKKGKLETRVRESLKKCWVAQAIVSLVGCWDIHPTFRMFSDWGSYEV